MSEEGLDPVEVGRRLRIARETAGMTQAYAAARINVARTTLVAVEKGQRAVRTAELLPLARLYETSVNTLLRRESVYVDLVPRFRKLPACKEEVAGEAVRMLEALVQAVKHPKCCTVTAGKTRARSGMPMRSREPS